MPGNLSAEKSSLVYVDLYTEVFCGVGMKMNSMKTKSIIRREKLTAVFSTRIQTTG
jgi:hypothetical protein